MDIHYGQSTEVYVLPSARFPVIAAVVTAVLAGLIVFAIAGVRVPANSLLLSNVLQTLAVLFAAICCLRVSLKSSGYLRQLWMLLTTALCLGCAAQGLETCYQSIVHETTNVPWPSDVLFLVWVTPAIVMFLPPGEQIRRGVDWELVLDFSQIGIVALTAYLYFFYAPSRWEVEGPQMVIKVLRLQILRDALLFGGFLLRGLTFRPGALRAFFLRMAVFFLATSASQTVYLSKPIAGLARARWTDLTWCIPYFLAAMFAATWKHTEQLSTKPERSTRRGTISSHVLPVLIPLLVLYLGRRIAVEQLTLAWIAVAASFVVSAGRLVLTSERQRRAAETLLNTQEALRRSESMFSVAFRVSPDAVGITSMASGQFLEVNDGFSKLTGYSREETLGRTALELNVWKDAAHRAALMGRLQKEREVRDEEFACRTKSGEIRLCQFSGMLIELDKQPCALVIVRDITVRKQAEEALRASEERFRKLVEDLHVGVVMLGSKAETVFANRAALTAFGMTENEALGQKSSAFEMTAIRENGVELPFSLRPGPRAITMKEPVRNEVVGWRRPDSGEVFWTLVDAVPHLDAEGNVARVLLSISNITKRVQAEEALRASEQRFRSLVREMDVGVVLHGVNAEVQFANEAAQQMFGISLDDARGKTSGELELIAFREDGTGIPFAMRPAPVAIRTGKSIKEDVIGWRKPGSPMVLWTLSNVVPQVGPDGVVQGAISTFTDITERRRAEDALHQLSTRLLQLQDEERRRLGRELHDSLAQTVLAVNLNLAQAMQSTDSLSERTRKALTEARSLLQEMSQEIRTMSYLLHPPLLDELGLVSAIKEYAEGFSQRSGIAIELDLAEAFGRLRQEAETALFRIVQESLSNIQRHSGSESARISLRANHGQVRLEVSDHGQGMGIPTGNVLDSRGARLGVGILGMRERLSQLGGKLEINSSASGTTVKATIPSNTEVSDAGSHPGG